MARPWGNSMSSFIEKNEYELTQCGFNNESIGRLLWVYDDSKDPIEHIVFKYGNNINSNFILSNEEVLAVKEELKKDHHILIDSFLNYLIASSSSQNESRLFECCKEYVSYYFSNICEKDGGLASLNLTTIIKWTISRFPKYKKEISNDLFDRIINNEKTEIIGYFSLADSFLRDEKLSNIFSFTQYKEIYDKYFVEKTDSFHIFLYLDFYERYLQFLLGKKKEDKLEFEKKYCRFVINNIDLIDDYQSQILLQKVLDLMNALKCFSDDEYLIVNEHLEKANKAAVEALQSHSIPVPNDQIVKIKELITNQESIFSKLSNPGKMLKLLCQLPPISKFEIKKFIDSSESSSVSLIQEYYLDSDGRVINYDKLSADEVFSLKANGYIEITIRLFSIH